MTNTIVSQVEGGFKVAGKLNRNTVVNLWPEHQSDLSQSASSDSVTSIDLAEVTHIDTAGLAWLVNLVGEQHRLEQKISIKNAPVSLLKLAKISNVDGILPLQ